MPTKKEWDIFISHASEDKDSFVRPLAIALAQLEVKVWYDEFTLEVGDSLSRSIDMGLARSKFGLVVVSESFMAKKWPERELRGLVAREIEDEQVVILPIWLGVSHQQVLQFSPPLADTLAIKAMEITAEEIAISILKKVRPDIYKIHPRSELEKMITGEAIHELQEELETVKNRLAEYECSYCKAELSERAYPLNDVDNYIGEILEIFACGHQVIDGETVRPCPSDPCFPKLDEYDIKVEPSNAGVLKFWARFIPKTANARRLSFTPALAKTEEEANQGLIEQYNRIAKS